MKKPPIIWANTIVLTATPLIALIGIPWYGFTKGFVWQDWVAFGVFMWLTGMSITAGYHRLWSHKAYRTVKPIQLFWSFWGATSLQNSILNWSTDHRRHHAFVDDDHKDPYSASRGFWFSHVGWVLRSYPSGQRNYSNVKDLQNDRLVMWQHRYYIPLAIAGNALLPLALGFLWGNPLGTLLLAGVLRIVLNHHFTFFINSLAHIWGGQPYSKDNSARDNSILAFFTYGEGYHNYHHRFQYDFRNGIKWWHFDPTKWMVTAMSWFKLTSHLRRANPVQVERVRLQLQYNRTRSRLEKLAADAAPALARLEEQYTALVASLEAWAKAKNDWIQAKKAHIPDAVDAMKQRCQELKMEMKERRRLWLQFQNEAFA